MVGEVTGFLHIVRVDIAFAPLGGRLQSRHAMVQGLARLTAFVRPA